jgi:hypothetical protein
LRLSVRLSLNSIGILVIRTQQLLPALGKRRIAAVLYAYGLLVYCSTIEYYDHIDRLSAVSKATGRSNGGPQPIRILSPIDGGVRGIAALERSFASR